MHEKKLKSLFGLVLLSCSSGGVQAVDAQLPQKEGGARRATAYTSLINKTTAYPDGYSTPAGHRGTVAELTYSTRDYVSGTNVARSNNAYVYLPYNYDASGNTRYNVLYLVHGHYGDASTFLSAEDGLLRNILDHMIENGDIDPLIVVTPTYNYGQPTANYVDAGPYCRALPLELQHDLMPLVESRYHAYADAADSAGLSSSRDHRAIGGFSMGGVTTWFALDETLAFFRYFLPMSGDCWSLGAFAGMNRPQATTDYLIARISEQGFGQHDFYIWAASGTSDSAYGETLNQVEGMADNSFFTRENLTFHEKNGARHEYRPMMEYIYNALSFFFPPSSTTNVNAPTTTVSQTASVYTISGLRVKNAQKHGVYIVNGKKHLR